MNLDPCNLTATELSIAYRENKLSPVETVDALLARIQKYDPVLHAFVDVYATDARLAAEAAWKAIKSGYCLGPLHGVPVALKDLIGVKGRSCAAGSRVHLTRKSPHTATVVDNLVDAGAIVLGKVHTVELAFGGWGTNPYFGTPRNPWRSDIHYTPGGSSSGSGVAVAAGLTPLAIGTDTGGSVRIPAAFNGIVALKPTRGRVSNFGIEPLSPTLDSPGPMARSVEDVTLLYEAMQSVDSRDQFTTGVIPDKPFADMKNGVDGLRVGRIDLNSCGVMLDQATASAYETCLLTMERLGAAIEQVSLPHTLAEYSQMTQVLTGEAYALHGHLAEDGDSLVDQQIRTRLLKGKISARDYLQLLWSRPRMIEDFVASLGQVDALLTPTTAMPAQPVSSIDETSSPSELTRFVNLLGCCALAVPVGLTPDGLPLSLQIVGRPFDEAKILRIGWAFQQDCGWQRRLPLLPP